MSPPQQWRRTAVNISTKTLHRETCPTIPKNWNGSHWKFFAKLSDAAVAGYSSQEGYTLCRTCLPQVLHPGADL